MTPSLLSRNGLTGVGNPCEGGHCSDAGVKSCWSEIWNVRLPLSRSVLRCREARAATSGISQLNGFLFKLIQIYGGDTVIKASRYSSGCLAGGLSCVFPTGKLRGYSQQAVNGLVLMVCYPPHTSRPVSYPRDFRGNEALTEQGKPAMTTLNSNVLGYESVLRITEQGLNTIQSISNSMNNSKPDFWPNQFSTEIRQTVLAKSGGLCFYCGTKLEKFHVDHFHPRTKGGADDINNLVPACIKCNATKCACDIEDFRLRVSGYVKFNPKQITLLKSLGLEEQIFTAMEDLHMKHKFWFEKQCSAQS